MQALLLSQHADEAAILTIILQQAGFMVRSIRDIERAIESLSLQPVEFIVVCSGGDQTSSLKELQVMRSQSVVPIVAIVDRAPEDFLVDLLEKGADLVVCKPYGVRFLLAQIRALLRRSAGMPFFSLPTLTQANLVLNPADRTVRVGDRLPVRLTQLEFRLLYQLMTHVGQIIPTENIVEQVWGYRGEGNKDLVRGLVQRLRAKIEPDPRHPKFVRTESGIGYFFNRFDD